MNYYLNFSDYTSNKLLFTTITIPVYNSTAHLGRNALISVDERPTRETTAGACVTQESNPSDAVGEQTSSDRWVYSCCIPRKLFRLDAQIKYVFESNFSTDTKQNLPSLHKL